MPKGFRYQISKILQRTLILKTKNSANLAILSKQRIKYLAVPIYDLNYPSNDSMQILYKDLPTATTENDGSYILWIKRQFDCETKIIRINNERAIKESDIFKDWVIELGLEIEYSSEYIHEQNGAAERAGAIITTIARALRIESLLPQSLFPEIATAAVYLLNRTSTKILGWKSPLRALEEYLHIDHHSCAHLHAYGCRAYAKIPNEILNRNRSQKLDPRAHIGYLVGYDSTNIFRIWIPHLDRVIRTRDVIFNENRRYNPDEPHIEKQLRDWVVQEVEFLDIEVQEPRVGTPQQENNLCSDIDIFRPDEIPPHTENVDKDNEDINEALEAQLMADILSTPDSTPEPDSNTAIEPDLSIDIHPILSHNRVLRANEISSDFNEFNIIEVIPLQWVFIYKFDDDGYLIKFKARICV
ncbi:predicted protein [Histoplasma mississippiense (nom. inval.)]|uniref:predicted protein n=1 Tax=Ajellomyces capsulatus (strain NAm1 / WU24) TaxID=2059318 RepID=UPI000157C828|nr:predicted protein [Histoplasma mississippiense (nom. inval.)]EDN09823.1 predicted protein [Histoplasma mississippiense (nom. inval.)]